MADVNANIGVNIDTSDALSQLKALQREIARFHSSISRGSESAMIAQRNLQRTFIDGINSIGAFSAEMRTIRTTSESFTDSLEKNKFSMREYFRYAGAATKTFGKLFRSEYDTIGKVAEDRVKKLQTQYIKMGRDASGAMKAIAVIPNELDMKSFSTQTQIAAQRQAIFNQLVKQGSTNLLNFGKNTQWAGRQLMVGFTLPLITLGTVATRTFMQMETAAIKFRKVYGDLFTPASETMAALENIKALGQVFTRYGIAVSDTVALAAEAAAAGFQGVDLQRQVTEATRLQVLGQVDQQKALETTISLQNAFRMSSEDLASSINFLNAVENQTVVSLDDITTAIPKAAPIIQELGGDVKDLAFFMAAMKEGGINASEGANALKSGLASLINPTDKAREMMSGFGIDIDNIVEKNVGNVKQTVIEFALALDNLSDLNRQRAIEQLFGKFQQARLSALFSNVIRDGNQAARVLDLAGASVEDLAALAEQELGITADSAMNKFRSTVEQLKVSLVPLGELFLQIVTPMIDSIGNMIEKFNNLPAGVKKVVATLVTVIGGIAPVVLMTIGLLANFVANGIKGVNLLRNGFLRLTGQSQILGEQTNFLTEEQAQAMAVAHSLDQSHARLVQTFNAETGALRALRAEYQRALVAASAFALRNPGMMRGPFPGFKNGILSVPGSGTEDKYPAMLAAGEAVIPAKQNKKYAALIQGIVADNIPGFKGGNIKSMYGGQERLLAPYTMFAPGNVPGGFGMSRSFLDTDAITESLSITAVAAGSIEGNIRLTDKAILEMAQTANPFTKQITEQLRIAAKEMSDSGRAATHISELFQKKEIEIRNILSNLSGAGQGGRGMATALQKTFYPTTEDIMSGGNVRVPGVDIDEQGRIVRAAPRSVRSGVAGAFQKKSERVRQLLGISSAEKLTRAHVVPENLVLPGKVRPIAGGALGMPMEAQMAGRAELERRSAILSQKLGRSDAFAYDEGRRSTNIPDLYVQSRKRNSPHPMAAKDGRDDAIAYSNARDKELSRRGRRRATSAGGTVGAGGVIIAPGGGGGGRGGGPTFLGMPGMPEKQPTVGGRFANFRTKFAGGKFAGAGMAASMGVMAASMLPGKMGELASKMMPVIFGFQALQLILKLPSPIKLFILGLTASIGIIKLVNAAREKERRAIEGLADAMSTTEKQVKALGDFFGVAPSKLPFDIKNREIVGAKTRSQREALKANPEFQAEFKNTIESLRKATNEEAKLVFSSLALNLKAQGFAEDQVQTIIDALREESAQTDVVLDVKSLSLSDESIKSIKGQMAPLLVDFAQAVAGSEVKSAISQTSGEVVTWLDLTKDAKKQLATLSTFISDAAKSASGMFELGLIDGKSYKKTLSGILETTNGLDAAQRKLLLAKVFDNLGVSASSFLGKLTDVKQEMMLLALTSSGILTKDSAVMQDLMATGQDAEFRRSRGIYGLTKAYENLFGAIKKVNEEDKESTGGGDTGKESYLTKQIRLLENQTKAYRQLRIAGVSASMAIELASNEETAALLKTQDGIKKVINQIREYERLKKRMEKLEIAGQELGDFTKTTLEMQKAAFELQELLINMQYTQELEKQNKELTIQERNLSLIEDKINKINKDSIRPIQDIIEENNYQLEKIGFIEDEINEKYDKQEETLDRIAQINEEINTIQKGRLSIADALSRGDIAAAAQAVQELKSQQLGIQQAREKRVLDSARKQQIDALGRVKLEKENKKLQQDILKIEYEKIRPLEKQKITIQDQIDTVRSGINTIQFEIFTKINAMNDRFKAMFGMTKTEIENAVKALDLAKAAGIDINDPNLLHNILAAAKGDATAINKLIEETPGLTLAAIGELVALREKMNLPTELDPRLKASLPIQVADPSCPSGYAYFIVRYEDKDGTGAKEVGRERVGCVPGGAVVVNVTSPPGVNVTQAPVVSTTQAPVVTTTQAPTVVTTTGAPIPQNTVPGYSTPVVTTGAPVPQNTVAGYSTPVITTNAPATGYESISYYSPILPPQNTVAGYTTPIVTIAPTPQPNTVSGYTTPIVTSAPIVITPVQTYAPVVITTKAPTSSNTVIGYTTPIVTTKAATGGGGGLYGGMLMMAKGGIAMPQYFAKGSLARGTDKIPAMLSPGEFVVSKYAVQNYGVDRLRAINDGAHQDSSVYNYSINVNVKSGADANDIARKVITQIQQIDSQRIRGQRY